MARPAVRVIRLPGFIPYEVTWQYMRALCEFKNKCRKEGKEEIDYLLLLQHRSVYTLGKGGSVEYLRFPSSAVIDQHDVHRVERGGEVTWHGPGQLVGYPVLNLHHFKKDLHWYTRNIEESIIRTIAKFGVIGTRSEVNTGVWIENNKLAAVGISATRWITYHGFSINIDCDLKYFDNIIPCGITLPDRGVCRLEDKVYDHHDLLHRVQSEYISSFSQVFDTECIDDNVGSLELILDRYPEIKHSKLTRLQL